MSTSWTLARTFAARAEEHPDRAMLIAAGRTWSYGQVDAKATALAAALGELGIEADDRIAIVMPNWPEWVITLLAAAKLGVTVVPLNARLSYHELKYQLRHAEVSAVFAAERHGGIDYLQIFEDIIAELPDLLYLVTVGDEELWYDDRIFRFEDLLSSGEGRALPSRVEVDDDSDLALLYTSGTMGKPKGVRLSHRNIVEAAVRTGEALEMDPADRVLVSVPLFTIFGFSIVVGTLAAGATVVLQDTFDADRAVELLKREDVTVMHGVPRAELLLRRLLHRFQARACEHLPGQNRGVDVGVSTARQERFQLLAGIDLGQALFQRPLVRRCFHAGLQMRDHRRIHAGHRLLQLRTAGRRHVVRQAGVLAEASGEEIHFLARLLVHDLCVDLPGQRQRVGRGGPRHGRQQASQHQQHRCRCTPPHTATGALIAGCGS